MSVLSIRMSDEEYKALEKYAKVKSISMNQAMKQAFFEKLEDEFDVELFDSAYAEYLKDSKTYSIDEVIKELDINELQCFYF